MFAGEDARVVPLDDIADAELLRDMDGAVFIDIVN